MEVFSRHRIRSRQEKPQEEIILCKENKEGMHFHESERKWGENCLQRVDLSTALEETQ